MVRTLVALLLIVVPLVATASPAPLEMNLVEVFDEVLAERMAAQPDADPVALAARLADEIGVEHPVVTTPDSAQASTERVDPPKPER
jgi:hypothetical protein